MLEEMDNEFGIGNLVEAEFGQKKRVRDGKHGVDSHSPTTSNNKITAAMALIVISIKLTLIRTY